MRDTTKILKRDLAACLSIVTDLDNALGDPLTARNLAFDLEARLHDALKHGEEITVAVWVDFDAEICGALEGTMQLETLLCVSQEERPRLTAECPLVVILDAVFHGLYRAAFTLDPAALNSCMEYHSR